MSKYGKEEGSARSSKILVTRTNAEISKTVNVRYNKRANKKTKSVSIIDELLNFSFSNTLKQENKVKVIRAEINEK